MHILLINTNPVVSRLLALCTRDAEIILEEVEDITMVKEKYYDIVFVDEVSYENEVLALDSYIDTGKKVLLSNEGIKTTTFDMTIKKPFLPSQIIALLENIETREEESKTKKVDTHSVEDEKISIFPLSAVEIPEVEKPQVLDSNEVEKIKVLLDMDDEPDISEILSEDEIEERKIEVIKEQLIADGLEILDEDEIVEELSAKDDIKIFEEYDLPQVQTINTINLDTKKSKKKVTKIKQEKNKKKNKKVFEYTEQELEKIEDAIQMAIATLKKKQMKKLLKGKKIKVDVQIQSNDK